MRAALLSTGNKCEVRRIARPALKSREVLIRVSHASMSRPDVNQRRGEYPPLRGHFDPLGLELGDFPFDIAQQPSLHGTNSSHTFMTVFASGGYSEMAQVEDCCVILPAETPVPTKRNNDNNNNNNNKATTPHLGAGGETRSSSASSPAGGSNAASASALSIPHLVVRTREVLGLECSGTIEDLSDDCERAKEFPPGTRVMALLPGAGFAEYVAVDEGCVMKIPPHMDFASAAAIPEAFVTAYQLLETIGHVKKEDIVLIHAGASGVGTAATQLCRLKRCRDVIVTASGAKNQACEKLGATRVFDRNSSNWGSEIAALTGSQHRGGVNLILDCVGGPFLEENVKLAARDARWILFGMLGGYRIPNPETRFLRDVLCKRITLTGSTLRTRPLEYKRDLVAKFTREVLPHFETGEIKPVLDRVKFKGLEKVEEGLNYLQQDVSIGKVVVSVE